MKIKLPFKPNINEASLFEEEDLDMVETMEAMTAMVNVQQKGAIDLTKLVLEYCKDQSVTKDYIFAVFKEAVEVVKDQLNLDEGE